MRKDVLKVLKLMQRQIISEWQAYVQLVDILRDPDLAKRLTTVDGYATEAEYNSAIAAIPE